MPPRKRKVDPAAKDGDRGVSAAEKIAGVLALIATRGMDTDDAALKLDAIGFGAREISALLNVGPNYVHLARHRAKRSTRKPRKKS